MAIDSPMDAVRSQYLEKTENPTTSLVLYGAKLVLPLSAPLFDGLIGGSRA